MVTFELKNDSIEKEQMYTIHILSSLYVFIAVWTKLISSNYGTLHEHSTIFYNYSLHILISENMPLKNPRWNLGKPLLSLLLLLFSYYACFLTSSPLHDGLMIRFRIDPVGGYNNPKCSGIIMKKYLFRIDPGWISEMLIRNAIEESTCRDTTLSNKISKIQGWFNSLENNI